MKSALGKGSGGKSADLHSCGYTRERPSYVSLCPPASTTCSPYCGRCATPSSSGKRKNKQIVYWNEFLSGRNETNGERKENVCSFFFLFFFCLFVCSPIVWGSGLGASARRKSRLSRNKTRKNKKVKKKERSVRKKNKEKTPNERKRRGG